MEKLSKTSRDSTAKMPVRMINYANVRKTTKNTATVTKMVVPRKVLDNTQGPPTSPAPQGRFSRPPIRNESRGLIIPTVPKAPPRVASATPVAQNVPEHVIANQENREPSPEVPPPRIRGQPNQTAASEENALRADQKDVPTKVPKKSMDELVAKFVRNKRADVEGLKRIRAAALKDEAALEAKLKAYKEQHVLADGVFAKEMDLWETASGGDVHALFQFKRESIKDKTDKLVAVRQDAMKLMVKHLLSFSDATEQGESRDVLADLERAGLNLHTEASKNAQALIEDVVSAYVKGENKFVSVAEYYPPMVFQMVRVGILKLHPEDPKLAELKY